MSNNPTKEVKAVQIRSWPVLSEMKFCQKSLALHCVYGGFAIQKSGFSVSPEFTIILLTFALREQWDLKQIHNTILRHPHALVYDKPCKYDESYAYGK